MKTFFISLLLLIIYNIYTILCTNEENGSNHKIINNMNNINSEIDIHKKKLLFESYKYYNNNILFNTPRKGNSSNFTFAKCNESEGGCLPFPNDEINKYDISNLNCKNLISVVAFEIDDENNIYILDEGDSVCPAKLNLLKMNGNDINDIIIYNTSENVIQSKAILNGFTIDKINNYAYLISSEATNTNQNDIKKQSFKLILIDLSSKNVKTKEVKIVIDEKYLIESDLQENLFPNISQQLVSITLSCDGESLFISPLTNRKIYSISTKELRKNKKDLVINEGYKNDASLSLMASNMGNLFFTGIEKKVVYIAGQIDNDLSRFDYRSLDTIEISDKMTLISKISLNNGVIYLTYIDGNKTRYIEKQIGEDNTYEKSYMYKCTGLIYKYDWKSFFVWIIFAIIVIFIIIFVIVENKQDLDNNKNNINLKKEN